MKLVAMAVSGEHLVTRSNNNRRGAHLKPAGIWVSLADKLQGLLAVRPGAHVWRDELLIVGKQPGVQVWRKANTLGAGWQAAQNPPCCLQQTHMQSITKVGSHRSSVLAMLQG
jgi:hypothetical protein